MLKKFEMADKNSCLNKAGDEEPVFVLRAKDPIAAATIRFWAWSAHETGAHNQAKMDEALECARLFDAWRAQTILDGKS